MSVLGQRPVWKAGAYFFGSRMPRSLVSRNITSAKVIQHATAVTYPRKTFCHDTSFVKTLRFVLSRRLSHAQYGAWIDVATVGHAPSALVSSPVYCSDDHQHRPL